MYAIDLTSDQGTQKNASRAQCGTCVCFGVHLPSKSRGFRVHLRHLNLRRYQFETTSFCLIGHAAVIALVTLGISRCKISVSLLGDCLCSSTVIRVLVIHIGDLITSRVLLHFVTYT